MKKLLACALIIWFTVFTSCDPVKEGQCYPTRVKTTMPNGSSAISVTADYQYNGDTLGYIIYSTGETHYYEYDESGTLLMVKEVNDKQLYKIEYKLEWDGDEMIRVAISKMNFDYNDRLDLDTFYYAYRVFEYKGRMIEKEADYYREDENDAFGLVTEKEFSYDDSGNLSTILEKDVETGVVSTITMTYDACKNPFSALNLLFDGEESHINNQLTRSNDVAGIDFEYTVIYNSYLYPQQIVEKENSTISRNITYEYDFR